MEVTRDNDDSAERVDELMREERTAEMCLDYSERSKPPVKFLYAGSEACTFTSFSMVGGRIKGTMACAGDGPEPTRMTGSYNKASFTVTMSKQVPGDEGGGYVRTQLYDLGPSLQQLLSRLSTALHRNAGRTAAIR